MSKKKLCVCIPTYNRKEAVERVLREEVLLFEKYGIDIIIFDSGSGTETEEIVQAYRRHNSNLEYQRVDSRVPSNVKAYMIFEQMGNSEYEYIWLIHDHTVCSEPAVRYLLQALELKYDFYILHMQAGDYAVKELASLTDFLYEGAWRLNSFGASVIKRDTFLKNVRWDKMSKKYNTGETLNYSHIGFYYERAAELADFRACRVDFDRKDFLDFQRTEKVSWNKDILRICLECWGNVITKLPDVYHNKTETLRTQDKWFVSKYSLLSYKQEGIYGLREFIKYKKWIKIIYPEDYIQDFMIALLPYNISQYIYVHDLMKKIHAAQKNNAPIYIYGAGRHAVECEAFLRGCKVDVDGFVVTSPDGNPESLCDHPVYTAREKLREKKALVIVAVLTSGVSAVVSTIKTLSGQEADIVIFAE